MKEPPWTIFALLSVATISLCHAQLQDASSQTPPTPDVYGLVVLDEEHVVAFIKDKYGHPVSPQVQPGVPLAMVLYGSGLSSINGAMFIGHDHCDNTTQEDIIVHKDQIDHDGSHIVHMKDVILHKLEDRPYRICISWKSLGVDNPAVTNTLLDNTDGKNEVSTKEKEREYYLPMPLQICIVLSLLVLSGLFSGLNLGLMSLDPTELQLIINSGTKKERRYAEVILPVRKTGNFLLCSLLLGNVIVNSGISILFDDLTSGIVALIVSSFGIVIFGEIVPQSVCNRKGLAVGAYTIWITKFFMVVTSPLSWPIGKLLDKVLGEEVGRVYNKSRLAELIRMSVQCKAANVGDDFRIVSGALEYTEKTVKDIMTNIDDVFMLSSDVKLNATQVADIIKNGYTRIPVYEDDRNNVISLLNVKDLALLDPDDNLPIKTVCSYWAHPTRFVMEDTPLKVMLDEFMKGHYHLALVQKVEMREDTDNAYVLTGLVTLEDIIEEILQAEIVDETDVITDNRQKHKRKDAQLKDLSLLLENPEESSQSDISMQLKLAAVQWLASNCDAFDDHNVSNRVLQRLVKRNTKCEKITENSTAFKHLYNKGMLSNRFTLILEGRVQVLIGHEQMMFEAGPFHVFGSEVMSKMAELSNKFIGDNANAAMSTEEDTLKVMNRQSAYKPDFSVIMHENVTYLSITTDDFWQAFKSTCMERGQKITLSLNLLGDTETGSRDRVESLGQHSAAVQHSPHSERNASLHQLSPRIFKNPDGSGSARLRSNSGSACVPNPARATISSPKEAQKWLRGLKTRRSHGNTAWKEAKKEGTFNQIASGSGQPSPLSIGSRTTAADQFGLIMKDKCIAGDSNGGSQQRSTSHELLVRTTDNVEPTKNGDRL